MALQFVTDTGWVRNEDVLKEEIKEWCFFCCLITPCLCVNAHQTLPFILYILSSHLDSLLPFQHDSKETTSDFTEQTLNLFTPQSSRVLLQRLQNFCWYTVSIQAIQFRNVATALVRSVGNKRPTTACVKRPYQCGWYITAPYTFPSWSSAVCESLFMYSNIQTHASRWCALVSYRGRRLHRSEINLW